MIRRAIRSIESGRLALRDVVEGYLELQIARADALKLRAEVIGLESKLDAAETDAKSARAELAESKAAAADLRTTINGLRRLAKETRRILALVVRHSRHAPGRGVIEACNGMIRKSDAVVAASEGR